MVRMHVSLIPQRCARALHPLAAPLRALCRLPQSGAWLRLAGTATGEEAATLCLVLLHYLTDLLLAAGAEVIGHG